MRVFLGSTSEHVKLVEWTSNYLVENFGFNPVPWTISTAFPRSRSTLEGLQKHLEEVDAAIIFVTADDLTESRGTTSPTPRDNIIFEAGFFLGGLGPDRTRLLVQKGVRIRLPSDLHGITNESFTDVNEDPGVTLAIKVRKIAEDLTGLRPRGTPKIIRQLQERPDISGINAAVGPFRRILEEIVYPRVGKPDVREVDVIAAYRFNEVAKVLVSNLNRKDFSLRFCLANMWDKELAQIYLRKYYDRDLEHLQSGVKESITVTLGKLRDWSEPARRDQPPRFVSESLLAANIEIYLTRQRITHAYYRIDDLICVVPLEMQKSATPPPRAWVFTKDQSADTYSYYTNHFDSVIKESIAAFPAKKTKISKK